MSIVKTVVGRPVTFLIIFVLLSVLGAYAFMNLGVDFMPEIELPVVTISSSYSGASPTEMEDSITQLVEGSVANLKGVETITSTIETGTSVTAVSFAYGTDLDSAAADIRTNLGAIESNMPSGVNTQILLLKTTNAPVVVFQLSGNRSLSDVYQLANEVVSPLLERLNGVARVFILGASDPVIRVEVPQERLDAYSLSLQAMSQQLRRNNAQVLGGQIVDRGQEYLVETSGPFEDIDAIKNAIIAYRGQTPDSQKIIRVRDVANVYFDNEVAGANEVYVNQEPSIYLAIQKQSQANTVEVSDTVDASLPNIKQQIPPDMNFSVVFNTADSIRNSLTATSRNALWGMILAISILYIFLRSIRATLVISVSIPVSVIITIMFMYFLGLTLNLITLAGLALGVGMLVDNSVVILENIYRYRNRGVTLVSSAILGSKEMVTPIMASTLTSICVFLPLVLLRSDLGIVGELFTSLALTVVIALSASLLVAIFLVPVLASHYLRIPPSTVSNKKGFFRAINRGMEHAMQWVENLYKSILSALLKHRYLSLLGLIAILVLSVVLAPMPPFEAFPRTEENDVSVTIELPPGTEDVVTRGILFDLEEYILNLYEADIENTSVEVGQTARGPGVTTARGNIGTFTVYLNSRGERSVTTTELQTLFRERMQNYPSVKLKTERGAGRGLGLQSGPDIVVKVTGRNQELLRDTGEKIKAVMENIEGLSEPLLDVSEPMPEINVIVDRQRAYRLGVSIDSVGAEIKAALNGVTTGSIELNGNEYDIMLSLPDENTDELPDLTRLFVTSATGQKIALSNLVSFERGIAPQVLERENQSRILNVTATIATGYSSSELVPELQRQVTEQVPFQEGVSIEYTGSYNDFVDNMRVFILFGVLAILLVYGVMASLFESFLDPFIILFTIPLTVVGVLVIYAVTGDTMNSFTAIGLIMLFGIVVNNGIVLIDYTNLLRHRGMALFHACAEAGKARLRPILMTTLTTIFGLLPIAFITGGEGTELIQPIAKTVVGGLAGGAFLTLFLVPILYAILNVWSDKISASRMRRVKKSEEAILKGREAI